MVKPAVFVSLMILSFSCSNSSTNGTVQKNDLKIIKEHTMALHDSLMARMPEIRLALKRLDSVATYSPDSTISVEINPQRQVLSRADSSMWAWMHQFKYNYKVSSDSATLGYFQHQYTSLIQIDSLFDVALKTSK